MIVQALIIFVSIAFGYLLRDNNVRAMKRENKHKIEEIKKEKGQAEILEYEPPKDVEKEEAEKIARGNMSENI